MGITKRRLFEVLGYYSNFGEKATLEHYNLRTDTLRRYIHEGKTVYGLKQIEKSHFLQQIAQEYTDKELQAIAKGGRIVPGMSKVPVVSFKGDTVKIGAFSDVHLGSKYTDTEYINIMFEEFDKQGVDFATCSGDVTEGMSNRAGHVYELSHIGYTAQKEHAIEVLKPCPVKLKMIDGNHDQWYIKSNGAKIVKDICEHIPQAEYLGHDEADISLKGKATLRLWHGKDGNSYATSYRLQKVIESFTGGEKPDAMLAGHTHKSLYVYERHIHCYSLGSLQKQTSWMRTKRIPSHTGFWIIEFTVNENGIACSYGRFYPFYS